MASRHGRTLVAAAFTISAIGTAALLAFLAVLGPFGQEAAPPLIWSIVLWGMVGMVTFLLLARLVLFALATMVGLLAVGKRSGLAAAHLLRVTLGI